ncbi:MAG: fumarylacetoacetate hydrolase family protein [Aquisalinus sp.]|nr:fumarylacetoacetate hydrolase family protein [Aquisalinus sp.]
MSDFVFAPPEQIVVPVAGGGLFPVRRIFCVGKNYADHVKEMGGDPKDVPPVFFTKPADAVHTGGKFNFPLATDNLHHEGEMVVALKSGGTHISEATAASHIFGYAAGCDLTRRDLQAAAKEKRGPWDTAKALDDGAVIGPITPASDIGVLDKGSISLSVNGETRQQSDLSLMIWSLPEIIARLSGLFELKAGDLIYTGTPEGVGALVVGDTCRIEVEGLSPLDFQVYERHG